MKYAVIFISILWSMQVGAQEKVYQTFKDTRVINGHSVETLEKGKLDFRITHRFGDLAGDAGGFATFYGLENAADVLMGLEYGLSDNFMIGISRAKGSGSGLTQNVTGLAKIRLLQQEKGVRSPFSLAFVGMTSLSTKQASENPGNINFFENYLHRISYNLQVIMATKISDRISIQGSAGWTYRNIVPATDQNDLVNLAFAAKYQFSKVFGFIVEGIFPIAETRKSQFDFYPPLSMGFEWETGGGHVFQINLTNARGIVETDYIPYTKTSWGDGEFRLFFTISRLFSI